MLKEELIEHFLDCILNIELPCDDFCDIYDDAFLQEIETIIPKYFNNSISQNEIVKLKNMGIAHYYYRIMRKIKFGEINDKEQLNTEINNMIEFVTNFLNRKR